MEDRFRLHFDIPFDPSLHPNLAIDISKMILEDFLEMLKHRYDTVGYGTFIPSLIFDEMTLNCRLGKDSDRQKSNYLDLDSNGHCSHKKTRRSFSTRSATVNKPEKDDNED